MKLPNGERAIVAREKITGYLLSLTSLRGRHKARFLHGFGFHPGEWEALAVALKVQGNSYDVARVVESAADVRYYVDGPLETPDGRNPRIRTVWQIVRGGSIPRFITAFPRRR